MFAQTQQMLDILERLVARRGYAYHRMDGGTAVALRSRLVDDFNNNDRGGWVQWGGWLGRGGAL